MPTLKQIGQLRNELSDQMAALPDRRMTNPQYASLSERRNHIARIYNDLMLLENHGVISPDDDLKDPFTIDQEAVTAALIFARLQKDQAKAADFARQHLLNTTPEAQP